MKNLLLDNAAAISEVRRTAEALKTGGVSLNGVSGPVKTVIIAALDRIFSEQGSLAFLVASALTASAARLKRLSLQLWTGFFLNRALWRFL